METTLVDDPAPTDRSDTAPGVASPLPETDEVNEIFELEGDLATNDAMSSSMLSASSDVDDSAPSPKRRKSTAQAGLFEKFYFTIISFFIR